MLTGVASEDFVSSLVRGLAGLLPLVIFAVAYFRRPLDTRQRGAVWLTLLWNLQALFLLNLVAIYFSWWDYGTAFPVIRGIPLDLLFGWALLWGPLPFLLAPQARLPLLAVLLLVFDLVAMPLLEPIVMLGDDWLIGEALGLLLVFMPGQLLGRWTYEGRNLRQRTMIQAVGFAGLALFCVPLALTDLLSLPVTLPTFDLLSCQTGLLILSFVIPSVLGLSAVQEFVEVGHGTPFPSDPPRRLVQSGVYRFVSNPMQLSYLLTIPALIVLYGAPGLLILGPIVLAFGWVVTRFEECGALSNRFKTMWQSYREGVPAWIPRRYPYVPVVAQIQVANPLLREGLTRFLCWTNARGVTLVPTGEVVSHAKRSIQYTCGEVRDEGAAAIARTLEHTNFMLALLGCFLRFPIVRQGAEAIYGRLSENSVVCSEFSLVSGQKGSGAP